MRARSRKEDQPAGGSLITALSGFLESLTSSDPPTTATSTQPPLLEAVLFRQQIDGSSNSITRTPSSPQGVTSR